jgi:hypothetical protein
MPIFLYCFGFISLKTDKINTDLEAYAIKIEGLERGKETRSRCYLIFYPYNLKIG